MIHKVTAPYTPQNDGVAKSRNKTILDMTRSMLRERKLPKYFWGEFVSPVSFILNRCPTKGMKGITQEEAQSGRKHDVSHYKIFSSRMYQDKSGRSWMIRVN